VGVEPGGEAGAVLGGVEPADGDVAPESPVVVAVGAALAAVDGAASRATVTASGSDEGVPMTLAQKRESAGRPRRVRLLRRRGLVWSMALYRFEPPSDPGRRCVDNSVSFGAIEAISAQQAQFRNLAPRWRRCTNFE
jgi:hypothetical protein